MYHVSYYKLILLSAQAGVVIINVHKFKNQMPPPSYKKAVTPRIVVPGHGYNAASNTCTTTPSHV